MIKLFLITRISLSVLCASVAGMFAVGFIYCVWGLGEDIYFAINPEPEEVVEPYVD
jgi:hypothetical protein